MLNLTHMPVFHDPYNGRDYVAWTRLVCSRLLAMNSRHAADIAHDWQRAPLRRGPSAKLLFANNVLDRFESMPYDSWRRRLREYLMRTGGISRVAPPGEAFIAGKLEPIANGPAFDRRAGDPLVDDVAELSSEEPEKWWSGLHAQNPDYTKRREAERADFR